MRRTLAHLGQRAGAHARVAAFLRPSRIPVWLLACCALLLALPATARELYWRELSVTARLDAGGQLHVSELHRMVFTGDYNGGERRFRIEPDQRIDLERLLRIEDDGREVQLSEGDLSSVDRFAWHGEHVLRWRSREPQAPPFEHTLLTYRIDYVLGGVLLDEGEGRYTLDHDFAFPDRPGTIERFRLHLEADPVWSSTRAVPLELERERLAPRESVVVTLALGHAKGVSAHVSASRPAGPGAPLSLRLGLAAALLCAVLLIVRSGHARERELGRFDSVPDAAVSADWLSANLFDLRPELVGALYHERVGVEAVAALLARLELEGKIRSVGALRSDAMQLELLVEKAAFAGYERPLIDKLFVAGPRTSAKLLRAHYSGVGFYPPSVLFELAQEMRTLLGMRVGTGVLGSIVLPGSIFGAGLFIASIVLVASHPVVEPSWLLSVVPWGSLAFALFGVRLARRAAAAVRNVQAAHERLVSCLVAGALGMAVLLVAARTLPLYGLVVLSSLALCIAWVVSALGCTSLGRNGVALRRRLLIARQQLTELLARGERNEAWVPYLVALDLREGLEAMLRGTPAPVGYAPEAHRHPSSIPSSSAVSAGNDAPWVGGGGRFGGGGASFAWGDALSELARGVSGSGSGSFASPMGGGGSGGSGSGGGSSGGGGGGGW